MSHSHMPPRCHTHTCRPDVTLTHAAQMSHSHMPPRCHTHTCRPDVTLTHAAQMSHSHMPPRCHTHTCRPDVTLTHATQMSQASSSHDLILLANHRHVHTCIYTCHYTCVCAAALYFLHKSCIYNFDLNSCTMYNSARYHPVYPVSTYYILQPWGIPDIWTRY